MNQLPKNIDRILRAQYGEHRRLPNEDQLAAYAQTLIRDAFPKLKIPLDFVSLESRLRYCRQIENGERGVIVIDRGQATLLSLGDHLLRTNDFDIEDANLLMGVVFAEAFRHRGALERALLCVANCLARRNQIVDMVRQAAQTPGHSSTSVFLILHEIAHFSVDTAQPFVEPAFSRVTESLRSHCEANLAIRERLRTGQALPPIVETSASLESDEDRSRLARQIADHLDIVAENRQVIREACCDVVATFALLSSRSTINLMDEPTEPITTLTPKEVGDVLMLGLRTSRLLMVHEFAKQAAQQIADDEEASQLATAFSCMTARHSVVTNVLLEAFDRIMRAWRFDANNGNVAPPDMVVALTKMFRQSVEVLTLRSADRLLAAVENIGLFHRAEDIYKEEIAKVRHHLFGLRAATEPELRKSLNELIGALPF